MSRVGLGREITVHCSLRRKELAIFELIVYLSSTTKPEPTWRILAQSKEWQLLILWLSSEEAVAVLVGILFCSTLLLERWPSSMCPRHPWRRAKLRRWPCGLNDVFASLVK